MTALLDDWSYSPTIKPEYRAMSTLVPDQSCRTCDGTGKERGPKGVGPCGCLALITTPKGAPQPPS